MDMHGNSNDLNVSDTYLITDKGVKATNFLSALDTHFHNDLTFLHSSSSHLTIEIPNTYIRDNAANTDTADTLPKSTVITTQAEDCRIDDIPKQISIPNPEWQIFIEQHDKHNKGKEIIRPQLQEPSISKLFL